MFGKQSYSETAGQVNFHVNSQQAKLIWTSVYSLLYFNRILKDGL